MSQVLFLLIFRQDIGKGTDIPILLEEAVSQKKFHRGISPVVEGDVETVGAVPFRRLLLGIGRISQVSETHVRFHLAQPRRIRLNQIIGRHRVILKILIPEKIPLPLLEFFRREGLCRRLQFSVRRICGEEQPDISGHVLLSGSPLLKSRLSVYYFQTLSLTSGVQHITPVIEDIYGLHINRKMQINIHRHAAVHRLLAALLPDFLRLPQHLRESRHISRRQRRQQQDGQKDSYFSIAFQSCSQHPTPPLNILDPSG